MQFLRNSLSLSFISNPQNQAPEPAANGTTVNGDSNGVPRRGDDDGKHNSPSPSVSTVSERTQYATVRSKVPLDLGSPPSAYSTPFQSPIIASRTYPVLSGAARALNDNGSNDTSNDGAQSGQERPSKVYFIEQGQLQTSYELPERPGGRSTRVADGGFANPAFTNDSGATMINMSSTQPSVIREQYWTWSCRCQREYTSREKVLLIVIFILVLIIGGLAAYLGIVVDSDDSITGGILTVNSLALSPAAQR